MHRKNLAHVTISFPFLCVVHDGRPKYRPRSLLCPSVRLHVTYHQPERLLNIREF